MFKVSDLTSMLDVQVNASTMVIVLLACWALFATSRYAFRVVTGMIGTVLKAFPLMFGTATALFIGGLGSFGYGVGELRSDPPALAKAHLAPEDLMKLAQDKDVRADNLKMLLEYAREQEQTKLAAARVEKANDSAKLVSLSDVWPGRTAPAVRAETVTSPTPSIQASTTWSSRRIGWTAILMGVGLAICGGVIFVRRAEGCK